MEGYRKPDGVHADSFSDPPSALASLAAALLTNGGSGQVSVDVSRAEIAVKTSQMKSKTVVRLTQEEVRWLESNVQANAGAVSTKAQVITTNCCLKNRPDLSFDDIYETVRELGTGATAEVRLVKHRGSGEEFAAKFVRIARDLKDDIDGSCRDIMARSQPCRFRVGMRVCAPARMFLDLSGVAVTALGGEAGDTALTGYVAYIGDAPKGSDYASICKQQCLGIVLDLALGSHDGRISGKFFFAAATGHGAFLPQEGVTMVRPGIVELMSPLTHAYLLRLQDWRAPKHSYTSSPLSDDDAMINWTHPVYDNDAGNCMVLVLEPCGGGDLLDNMTTLAAHGNVDERAVALIMRSVLTAVQFMHERGLIHHDLKENNILLKQPLPEDFEDDTEGLGHLLAASVRVCDFDISKREDDSSIHGGTPGYLAPELFAALNGVSEWGEQWCSRLAEFDIDVEAFVDDRPPYTSAIDSYALGAMLYRLLAGGDAPTATINYFDYDDWDAANQDALSTLLQPPSFGSAFDGVSEAARDLILKLMAPSPKARLSCEDALKHPWIKAQVTCKLSRQSSVSLTRFQEVQPKDKQKRIDGKGALERFFKTRFGQRLCQKLDALAAGGPAHLAMPPNLNSFHRRALHSYCESCGLQSLSVDREEPPGRVFVAWTGDKPADLSKLI